MEIGGTIRALREKFGWSQEELGWRVNASAANISRIETGKHGPGTDLLQAIAAEFNLKVHEIYALAEGVPEEMLENLPKQAEEQLLQYFRSMNIEQKQLLLKVGREFAGDQSR